MSNPIHSTGVLPRAPLIFVLAQVRMSPVLLMKDKIPAIQEELRKRGFTNFNTRRIEQTHLEAPNKIRLETREQWEFINDTRNAAVLVDQDSVALQTTDYETFSPFVKLLMSALDVVYAVAAPSQSLRLGIRYIDLITADGGRDLSFYVRKELRGPAYQCGKPFINLNESILQTDSDSKMVVRYVEAPKAGLAFPTELQPVNLKFKRSLNLSEPFGLLDLDHFEEKNVPFSLEAIEQAAGRLHVPLDDVFKGSVTPEAIAEWAKPA